MAEKYRIGSYEFDTKEEWEKALKDVKRIESIVDQIDIDNPDDVLVIYKLIREGKVTFESELGVTFFCDISDRVVNHSQEVLEERKEEKAKKKAAKSKESRMFTILSGICVAFAVICFLFFWYSEYSERRAVQKLEQIQTQKSISQAINWYFERLRLKEETATEQEIPQSDVVLAEVVEETSNEPQVLQEYAALHEQHPDLIGWMTVSDTKINLPVVQTTDNQYYLNKNIDGKEDINGTLFLDYRDDIIKQSTNLIVYGHNMKNGEMFGGLKKYLDKNYAASHDQICFDTIYEKQIYQIIAVCLSEVGYQDDNTWKYYDFIQAEDAGDIQTFLKHIRKCAVYDKTQEVTESDRFLTLSTCNNYVEDGRLFVVAKRIQ